MRRNDKSTYLIIALVCLILLNLGSMAIVFTKNIKVFKKEDMGLINKIKSGLNLKNMVMEVINFPFLKKGGRDKSDNNDSRILDSEDLDIYEDFIIIDTSEEYDNLIIIKDSDGRDSVENIPEPLNIKKVKLDKSKPYIFIYHTHATETFTPNTANNYHTTDNNVNMVNIGELLTKTLEANDHKVIHEKMQHDIPSYNQSYSRSLNTLKKVIDKEKNLKFFFDLHRDGIEKDKPNYERRLASFKTQINDRKTATFSLVIGPHNPNYDQLLSLAKYIKAVSDTVYPGLCTGIIVKKVGKFNQYISDYAALFEIGCNENTLDEARECIKLVGEILDIVIRSIQLE